MYCGDGINDLVALAAADVGMSVGRSHASAAATISDKHASVRGMHSFSSFGMHSCQDHVPADLCVMHGHCLLPCSQSDMPIWAAHSSWWQNNTCHHAPALKQYDAGIGCLKPQPSPVHWGCTETLAQCCSQYSSCRPAEVSKDVQETYSSTITITIIILLIIIYNRRSS